MRTIAGLALVFAAILSMACGPYVAPCAWIELEPQSGLRVVAPRKPISTECTCLRCGAPGLYQLEREQYVLEFSTGERWYPHLFVRARNVSGQKLVLDSDQLRRLPINPPKWAMQHVPQGFDYIAPVDNIVDGSTFSHRFPERIRMTVTDDEGRLLGIEEVVLHVETRRYLTITTI